MTTKTAAIVTNTIASVFTFALFQLLHYHQKLLQTPSYTAVSKLQHFGKKKFLAIFL